MDRKLEFGLAAAAIALFTGVGALVASDGFSGITANANRNFLNQAKHLVIGIDLDDLGIFRPVVHAMLWQGTERPKTGTQSQHHVGFGHQLHRGF